MRDLGSYVVRPSLGEDLILTFADCKQTGLLGREETRM